MKKKRVGDVRLKQNDEGAYEGEQNKSLKLHEKGERDNRTKVRKNRDTLKKKLKWNT